MINEIPTVGSTGLIMMSYPFGSSMIPPRHTTEYYTGEVLPSYKWMTDSQFCLSGYGDTPVRVIDISTVEQIRLINGFFRPVTVSLKTVKVAGSKSGVFYTVTGNRGVYTCSCPGFQFRRACKHIVEVSKT